MRQRENDFKAYSAGKPTSPGFDPNSAPPTPEQFYVQPPPAGTTSITINVPQAGGGTKPVTVPIVNRPHVNSDNNTSNSNVNNKKVDVTKLPGLVSSARRNGASDAEIRASAINDGYPPAAVDAALGPPKVLPVGHYQRGAFIPGP